MSFMTIEKKVRNLIDKLDKQSFLEIDELVYILDNIDEENKKYLFSLSSKKRDLYYGKKIYLRGLIEFTNYCKRECIYCGINAFNRNVKRYRMSKDEILDTCKKGSELGFSTFVLQGGEDPFYKIDIMEDIVKSIKETVLGCAITLSIGEKTFEELKTLKQAGVDRFLLRHETINENYYKSLHPLSELKTRVDALKNLKKLNYQTGAGFMVGLPNYNNRDYAKDIIFLKELNPEMVGVGPFIPHKDTEMRDFKAGDIDKTVLLLSLIRLYLPKVLLPATTALSSVGVDGRKKGFDVGCNVIMPNLTPLKYRGDYNLYNNKKITGSESAESLLQIKKDIKSMGFECDMGRGDNVEYLGKLEEKND